MQSLVVVPAQSTHCRTSGYRTILFGGRLRSMRLITYTYRKLFVLLMTGKTYFVFTSLINTTLSVCEVVTFNASKRTCTLHYQQHPSLLPSALCMYTEHQFYLIRHGSEISVFKTRNSCSMSTTRCHSYNCLCYTIMPP